MEGLLDGNIFVSIFLPIMIGLVMLMMGMSLRLEDFKRVALFPKAVGIGMFAQLVCIPVIAFLIVKVLDLDPILAVSLMLLAATPGGPLSNFLSFLANGDVALAVTLTAVNSIITVFTIPLLVNASSLYFTGNSTDFHLPFWSTVLQIALITLVPIFLGMIIGKYFPKTSFYITKYGKSITAIILTGVVFTAFIIEHEFFFAFLKESWAAVLLLNVLVLFMGYFIGFLAHLDKKQRITIGIESSMQNGALAISIAMSPFLLNAPEMVIMPASYSFIMSLTVVPYIYLVTKDTDREHRVRNLWFLAGFGVILLTTLILVLAL